MVAHDTGDLDFRIRSKLPACALRSAAAFEVIVGARTLEEQSLCSLEEANLALAAGDGIQFAEADKTIVGVVCIENGAQ